MIPFLTNQLVVFSRAVKHLWFSVVCSFGNFCIVFFESRGFYITKRKLHVPMEKRNFSSRIEKYFYITIITLFDNTITDNKVVYIVAINKIAKLIMILIADKNIYEIFLN